MEDTVYASEYGRLLACRQVRFMNQQNPLGCILVDVDQLFPSDAFDMNVVLLHCLSAQIKL